MRFKSSLKTFKLPSALSQNGQCAQTITKQLGDARSFLMQGISAQSKDAVMTHASSDSLPQLPRDYLPSYILFNYCFL